jgi:D-amino-acid oxidase
MVRAIVIGCGVSGLSTGIRLLEAGHEVAIWARDVPPNTTSNRAAAIWYPYRASPRERVLAWARRTLDALYELAPVPEAGISPIETVEVYRNPVHEPWWRHAVRSFRYAAPSDLPEGYPAGYVFETLLVEMPIYLPYLLKRFRSLGGTIEQREVANLDEPAAETEIVINCAGLGNAALLNDGEMYPVRGQLVRVERTVERRAFLDDYEDERSVIAYVVPRSTDTLLGGQALPGNWSTEPDPAIAAEIVARCSRLVPEVAGARVLEHLVGLRPGRSSVRLEAEETPAGPVVNNYGHGGAGVTLSWGCAEDVVRLVSGRHP